MVTPDKYDTLCHTADGVVPIMGHWMAPSQFEDELDGRFPGCMSGKLRVFEQQDVVRCFTED
jgi:phosphoenolpyruvate carboxykinase (GTP)